MAGINGNCSTICMQGQEQAPSFWLLAPRRTNPNIPTNTHSNPIRAYSRSFAATCPCGEIGGRA
jgi:hypothetical protein